MAAAFPTSVVTDALLGLVANGAQTALNGTINNSVTTITVIDTSSFPSTGYVVIDTEVINYTSKNSTQFLGCTRGSDSSAAAAHTSGVSVFGYFVAANITNLQLEVKAIETDINARFGIGASSNAIVIPSGVSVTIASTGGLAITPVTNQLVLGSTRTVTINAPTPATLSRIWTIPDISAAGTFAALEGAQTFSGAKTFSAILTMSGATIAMGAQKITGLAAGTTAGDALRYEQVFTTGTVTLLGPLVVPGSGANATVASPITLNANAKAMSFDTQSTTSIGSAAAVTIMTMTNDAAFIWVMGSDTGGSNYFLDYVVWGSGANPVVVSYTAGGAPAVRTYTRSGFLLKLQMASGTYSATVMALDMARSS